MAYLKTPKTPNKAVNAERQKRIEAGTVISVTGTAGIPVTGREVEQRNLLGLVLAASFRVSGGDTTTITVFRDGLNDMHDLTPYQVLELWQGGSAYISAVYAASFVLKDSPTIPVDYADDTHWPVAV